MLCFTYETCYKFLVAIQPGTQWSNVENVVTVLISYEVSIHHHLPSAQVTNILNSLYHLMFLWYQSLRQIYIIIFVTCNWCNKITFICSFNQLNIFQISLFIYILWPWKGPVFKLFTMIISQNFIFKAIFTKIYKILHLHL